MSGRISSSRSTSVTPKITAKAVIHTTPDTTNSMGSRGSHTAGSDRVVSPTRSDHNDSHSLDSSLSGSRSLHSPRLDGGHREGTPGVDDYQENEDEAIRGARLLVTNAECLGTNSHVSSANQNVHDNGNLASVDADISGGGGGVNGGGSDVVCTNGGAVTVNNSDKSVGGKSGDTSPSHDNTGVVTHLKDSRRVMFAEDTKSSSSSSSSSSDFPTEQKQITSQAGKFMITLKEEIPAGTCITVSMEMSPVKEVPDSMEESENSVNGDRTDHCVVRANSEVQESADLYEPSAASGCVETGSMMETSPHGASPEAEKSEISSPDDLIEDIPYYLERRLYDNGVADKQEVKSPPFVRRGRSSTKRRPTNMQIEHVKVYEGGSQSRNESPASGRSLSRDKETSKSMSPVGRSVTSRSPSTGHRYTSKSSLERSPSCNRKVEIVNVHKLPPRDSYSSVDDTTSPTIEKDVIRHIQSRGILGKSLSFRGEREVRARTPNLNKSSSFHGEKDLKTKIPNGGATFIDELHRKVSEIGDQKADKSKLETNPCESEKMKTEKGEGLSSVGNNNGGQVPDPGTVESVGDLCGESSVGLKLTDSVSLCGSDRVSQGMDLPSQAAAYLILNKDPPARKPKLKNITFSTFKPMDDTAAPGCRPSSVVDSETDAKSDYGSLPSAKHADSKKPLQIPVQPEAMLFNPTNTKVVPAEVEGKKMDRFYGPLRPRKVSFHRERGYKYSFESVNDPPAFALAEPIEDICLIDTTDRGPSKSPSTDVLDILEGLEDAELVETDTSESCTSSLDSDGPSDHSSSDEESHKHDEFLIFAKSLADSGKETTKDSGVGVDEGPVRSLSQDDPASDGKRGTKKPSQEKADEREPPNRRTLVRQSPTDSSLSSIESDSDPDLSCKRHSLDPLDDLENPSIAEVNTSFSDSSSDGEREEGQKTGGGFVIPTLTFSLPSSPDASSGSPKENQDNEFGSTFC